MRNTDSVIDLYDSLLTAQDERARARIIASAFERLEDRYPEIKDMATASGVRETELRLQKEIEQIKADLSKEIEQVRADLSKEIEHVRLRIEEVRSDLGQEIAKTKHDILRWTVGLLFAQLITILAALIGLNFM